jgi:hypothetical protein
MTQWVPYPMNDGGIMYWGMMERPEMTSEQREEIAREMRAWKELGPVERVGRMVDQSLPPMPSDARELLAILRAEQLGHSTAIAALRLLSSVMDLVYVTGPGASMAQFLSAWSHARAVLASDGKDQAPKPVAETPP